MRSSTPCLATAVKRGVLVLTITEAELHGDVLVDLVRRPPERAGARAAAGDVVLDLSQVRSLSSAAFRPLLGLRRLLQERGGRLALCNLAPVVAEALRAARLTGDRSWIAPFEVQPDVAAAVASLGAGPR